MPLGQSNPVLRNEMQWPNLRAFRLVFLTVLLAMAASCASRSQPDGSQPDGSSLITGTSATAGYHEAIQLTVGETTRSYDLYIPELESQRDDDPRPLVLLFHGQRGSAGQLMGQSGRGAAPFREWLRLADKNGIVLVIPNGVEGAEGHTGWNDCRSDATANPTVDDVGFVEAVIDEIRNSIPIDRDRVFATGISNGGHMSLRLAIERPNLVAAVAPIAAAMPAVSSCPTPTQAVPALFINGTDDPFLPFEGGSMPSGRGTVLSSLESLQLLVDLSTVDPVLQITALPNTASDDGSTVVAHRSSAGIDVWLYEIVGGGHTDPSRSERYSRLFKRVLGGQNGDIETASEIWAFFNRGED